MHRLRALSTIAALALGGQALPTFNDQVSAGWKALDAGRYLAAANTFNGAAFGPDGKSRDEGAYQSWQQVTPMLTGELPLDALTRRPTVPPPYTGWNAAIAQATARDAIAEIVRRAKGTSIVILNEAHFSPRDRAFGWEVARALRPLGYSVLAAETFANEAQKPGEPSPIVRLAQDGVVRLSSGSYTKDPMFAAYIRQSLRLGYRPVAYEQTDAQAATGRDLPAREQAQADNLMAAIFARDPQAKVLIHVGVSHVAEAPLKRGSGTVEWMAARLKRMTGIDPLTIDQVTVTDLSARSAYPIAAAKVGGRAGVIFAGDQPLVLGPYAGAVDLQVVHPARAYRHGRPTWLAALGGRPMAIPKALLPTTGERLVQAFAADAPADAVPLDQVLVAAGRPAPSLMLPRGVKVRFAVQP